jgi:hypothetical protein
VEVPLSLAPKILHLERCNRTLMMRVLSCGVPGRHLKTKVLAALSVIFRPCVTPALHIAFPRPVPDPEKEKQNDSTTTALIGIEPISLLDPDTEQISVTVTNMAVQLTNYRPLYSPRASLLLGCHSTLGSILTPSLQEYVYFCPVHLSWEVYRSTSIT